MTDPTYLWFNLYAPYVGGARLSIGDTDAEKDAKDEINRYMAVRRCPSYSGSNPKTDNPDNQIWLVVHYGDSSALNNDAPFVWVGVYPGKKVDSLNDPSTLICFLDGGTDSIMHTPKTWPFNQDRDRDGILDTYMNMYWPLNYWYNGGRPRAHMNTCNIVLSDGHVESIGHRRFFDMKNGLWTD